MPRSREQNEEIKEDTILNVLVVDDEFHARKLLADYVAKIPFLNLIATCPNVFEAMGVMQKRTQ